MRHSEQKCTHFCSEWSIVGYGTHFCSEWRIVRYGTSAFWDLWMRSLRPESFLRLTIHMYRWSDKATSVRPQIPQSLALSMLALSICCIKRTIAHNLCPNMHIICVIVIFMSPGRCPSVMHRMAAGRRHDRLIGVKTSKNKCKINAFINKFGSIFH